MSGVRMLEFLADWSLKGSVILLVAWAITGLLRKNAALKHLTWLTAFMALVLVPALRFAVPDRLAIHTKLVMAPPVEASSPSDLTAAPLSIYDSASTPSIASAGTQPADDQPSLSSDLSPVADIRTAPPRRPIDYRPMAVQAGAILWLVGFLAVAGRGILSVLAVARLRRRSVLETGAATEASGLGDRIGLSRSWELRKSVRDIPSSAVTWGLFHPVVLLPLESKEWSDERRQAVLLHELAHIRRGDSACQWFTYCLCAIHWFNPLAWLAARSLRSEAETAADDLVLKAGIRATDYAAELLGIAAEIGAKRPLGVGAGVAFISRPQIEARIRSIIDPANRRRGVTSVNALIVTGIGLISVSILGPVRAFAPEAIKKIEAAGQQAIAGIQGPSAPAPEAPDPMPAAPAPNEPRSHDRPLLVWANDKVQRTSAAMTSARIEQAEAEQALAMAEKQLADAQRAAGHEGGSSASVELANLGRDQAREAVNEARGAVQEAMREHDQAIREARQEQGNAINAAVREQQNALREATNIEKGAQTGASIEIGHAEKDLKQALTDEKQELMQADHEDQLAKTDPAHADLHQGLAAGARERAQGARERGAGAEERINEAKSRAEEAKGQAAELRSKAGADASKQIKEANERAEATIKEATGRAASIAPIAIQSFTKDGMATIVGDGAKLTMVSHPGKDEEHLARLREKVDKAKARVKVATMKGKQPKGAHKAPAKKRG